MSETLTKTEVERLLALDGEATPGPWSRDPTWDIGPHMIGTWEVPVCEVSADNESYDQNAELIVEVRNALPRLLDAAERAEVEKANAETWKEIAQDHQAVSERIVRMARAGALLIGEHGKVRPEIHEAIREAIVAFSVAGEEVTDLYGAEILTLNKLDLALRALSSGSVQAAGETEKMP